MFWCVIWDKSHEWCSLDDSKISRGEADLNISSKLKFTYTNSKILGCIENLVSHFSIKPDQVKLVEKSKSQNYTGFKIIDI